MGPEDFQLTVDEMDLQRVWDDDQARNANYMEGQARRAALAEGRDEREAEARRFHSALTGDRAL